MIHLFFLHRNVSGNALLLESTTMNGNISGSIRIRIRVVSTLVFCNHYVSSTNFAFIISITSTVTVKFQYVLIFQFGSCFYLSQNLQSRFGSASWIDNLVSLAQRSAWYELVYHGRTYCKVFHKITAVIPTAQRWMNRLKRLRERNAHKDFQNVWISFQSYRRIRGPR